MNSARFARRAAAVLLFAAILSAGNASAQEPPQTAPQTRDTPVDLELVLAVDASRSIDAFEYRLQRQGYAKALTHPDVLRAVTGGLLRRIAVTYVEWSGAGEQAVLVGWTVIDGPESAAGFAAALLAAPRAFYGRTSVSAAIDHAARLFDGNRMEGTRRVIDVSGDGPNNRGRPPEAARDDAVGAGITINGLAIVNDRPSRSRWDVERVDVHYRDRVIGGPGAFVEVVKDFRSFADGIRRKLIREIAALPPAPVDNPAPGWWEAARR